MELRLFGFGNSQKLDLEKLVVEIIATRGISLLASPPNGKDYHQFKIIGIGISETDDKGALKRFVESLDAKSPTSVYGLEIGYSKDRRTMEDRRSVSITGYHMARTPAA